jgi:ABC-2 type transport system permease protein
MITPHKAWAITLRVLHELGRDTRSRAILVVAPSFLMVIVRWLFDSSAEFSRAGAMMVGVIPFISLYLVGSTGIVRERGKGTLEAVLATPASRGDVVGGYLGAAVIVAFGQAFFTVTIAYLVSGLQTASPFWVLGILALFGGIFGMSLGLLMGVLSGNEGEAFQFIPGFLVPQLAICGMFWPLSQMAGWMQGLEHAMPLAAVTESMTAVRLHHYGGTALVVSGTALLALIVATTIGAAATIQRRTA